MRVGVLLLLFSLSCAELQRGDDQPVPEEDVQLRLNPIQNQSHEERAKRQTTVQVNVWTELKDLRDMVVEQKVKLQYSQTQIEELKKENAGLEGKMASTANEIKTLKDEKTRLEEKLALIANETKALKEEKTKTPKVAFSFGTGVSGSYGPLSMDTTLVFSREIINIGNAYSPRTGYFTAPVRGVYYFRYTSSGHSGSHWTTVFLFKNQQAIVVTTKPPKGDHDYASNGATLLLEKGEVVHLKLEANKQIWDMGGQHFTFSGFLLFTM